MTQAISHRDLFELAPPVTDIPTPTLTHKDMFELAPIVPPPPTPGVSDRDIFEQSRTEVTEPATPEAVEQPPAEVAPAPDIPEPSLARTIWQGLVTIGTGIIPEFQSPEAYIRHQQKTNKALLPNKTLSRMYGLSVDEIQTIRDKGEIGFVENIKKANQALPETGPGILEEIFLAPTFGVAGLPKPRIPTDVGSKFPIVGELFTARANREFRSHAGVLSDFHAQLKEYQDQISDIDDGLTVEPNLQKKRDLFVDSYNRVLKSMQKTSAAKFMRGYLAKRAELEIRGKDIPASIGGVLAVMPKYMGEFFATGGTYSIGKGLVTRGVAKIGVGGAFGKALSVAGGTAARTALLTANTYNGAVFRTLPAVARDEAGNVYVTDSGKSFAKEYLRQFAIDFTENLGEVSGKYLLGKFGQAFPRTGKVLSSWGRGKAASAVGFDGWVEEFGEERFTQVMRKVAGELGWDLEEDNWIPSARDMVIELGALAVPGVISTRIEASRQRTEPQDFIPVSPVEEKAIPEAPEGEIVDPTGVETPEAAITDGATASEVETDAEAFAADLEAQGVAVPEEGEILEVVPKEAVQAPEAGDPTSISLAGTEKLRAERGLAPVKPGSKWNVKVAEDAADAAIRANPGLPGELVARQLARPEALGPTETAILQKEYRRHNEARLAATEEYNGLVDSGAESWVIGEANKRRLVAEERLVEIEQADKYSGAEWNRAGVVRGMWVKADYTFTSMHARAKAAKAKSLTEKESAKVQKQADSISRLESQIRKWEKKRDSKDFTKDKATPEEMTKEEKDLRIELDKVKAEFYRDLHEFELTTQTPIKKAFRFLRNTTGVYKAWRTAFDVSAVGRQGFLLGLGHPIKAALSIPPMFRALVSKKAQEEIAYDLRHHPLAALADKVGLSLTEVGGGLQRMEEVFASRWSEFIPGIAASQRAYVTFLNKLRMDVFSGIVYGISADGNIDLEAAKGIANYTNVASGRGSFGDLGIIQPLFWAPRLVVSRFQFLAGQPLYNAASRKAVAKEYARSLLGLSMVYMMAGLAPEESDIELNFDPFSTQFGKIRVGNTWVDPMAGLSQATVFSARMIVGQKTTRSGATIPLRGRGKVFNQEAQDVLVRFLRSKLSPTSSLIADRYVFDEMFMGQPVTLENMAKENALPLAVKDILDAMEEEGVPKGLALGMLAVWGIGIQTHTPRPPGGGSSLLPSLPSLPSLTQ